MTIPDLIWEEVVQFLTPSELIRLLTLNRTIKTIIVNTATSSLTQRQVLTFTRKFPEKLSRIRTAQVNTDRQVRALLGATNLESLVTNSKYFSYKDLGCLLFHPTIQYLDLNQCQIDIGLTKLINSLPKLRKLYLPSFLSRQPRLPRYLSRIRNPNLRELSLTMDYLDYEIISLLPCTELTYLSLEAFDVKGPDRVLSIPFPTLNHLKIVIHKYQPQPILINPDNFPNLDQLTLTTKYALILPEPKFTADTFFKKYDNFGIETELCLSYGYRGLLLTTLHLEATQLDIRSVVHTLKLKFQLRTLSLVNINTSQLKQELNFSKFTTTHPTIRHLHFTATELTLDLLRWLPRTFPNIQKLHLGGNLTPDLTTEDDCSFPSLFVLQLGGGLPTLPLIRSLSTPTLSFLYIESTSLPPPTLKLLYKLRPQLHLILVPPHITPPSPSRHHSSHHLDHYDIYGDIHGLYNINTYGFRNQSVRLLPSTTYSRL